MHNGWNHLKGAVARERERKKRLSASEDLGDRLYYRLLYDRPKTLKELESLQNAVLEYLREEHPEEKKGCLRQYTEMLSMMRKGLETAQNETDD